MPKSVRWGILGPGGIARAFANGLKAAPGATLAAIGSRSQAKSEAFAKEFGAARAHGSYEALAADPGVDAIYIATPHPMHLAAATLCLERGKAVLCEKPITVNAGEAEQLIAVARRKKAFLMEAMWTRFLPAIAQVRAWLKDGAIGEPRMLSADFGFRCGGEPTSRLMAPDLAGGGLLDVGVYTVALASMVFGGAPKEVRALAHLGATGVDEQNAMACSWPAGQLAVLTSAVRTSTAQEARIYGTAGSIHVPGFWHARSATLHRDGKPAETAEPPFEGNGYNYQAVEVARCLEQGLTESPVIPLDESLAIQRTMDEARRQFGLVYPFEKSSSSKTKASKS
jgi:predicted dehydrogenase